VRTLSGRSRSEDRQTGAHRAGLESKRSLERVRVEEQIEGAGSAEDKNVRVREGVERAAFAVIDSNRDAAGIFHRAQKQAVIISVAESGDVAQIEFLCEVALLDVLPILSQHVWDGDSSELLPRGAVGIGSDDFEIDEFHQAAQTGPHAGRKLSAARECAGVIAHDRVDHAFAEAGNVDRDAGFSHGGLFKV